MIISPNILEGTVSIPASKSEAHRAIICACFADGKSTISNVTLSQDIIATIDGLKSLGADIEVTGKNNHNNIATVVVGKFKLKEDANIIIDCNESGSTLRFLIPIAVGLYDKVRFIGRGGLEKRPLNVYFDLFEKHNIKYFHGNDYLPLDVEGKLNVGSFEVAGDISSQFITGIMLAKGIGNEQSQMQITSKLESKPYIDITQDVMKKYGVETQYSEKENRYLVNSNGYRLNDFKVMGDWSHAGFVLLAGTSSKITIIGLDKDSKQGDKVIVDILRSMGANIYWKDNLLVSEKSQLNGRTIDVSQCPDLAPVIAGAMSIAMGESKIVGGERLKIKESDRIQSVVETINNLGGNAKATDDGMIIQGLENLLGGEVSCYNDHRIAMMIGALSVYCTDDIKVNDHKCVAKSYPQFWDDFVELGGSLK